MVAALSWFRFGLDLSLTGPKAAWNSSKTDDATGALIGRRAPESKENIDHFEPARWLGRFAIPRCSLTKRPFVTINLAIPWSFEPAGLQPR
jgi:hypothetical protein